MDSIEKLISPEKDVFYLMGEEKGQIKAEEVFIRNLLTKTSLSVEQAADISGVSVEFVE